MKLDILRKIIREEVKGAIQEELKDLLLEAIRASKPIVETQTYNSSPLNSVNTTISTVSKEQLRENYRNILGETAASFNTSQVGKPLQLNSSMDTTSPNGRLPEGEVSMNMIMGLMNKK
jgi:putative lipoic acid-binding regulatory protein